MATELKRQVEGMKRIYQVNKYTRFKTLLRTEGVAQRTDVQRKESLLLNMGKKNATTQYVRVNRTVSQKNMFKLRIFS